jgi:hypothetical protein
MTVDGHCGQIILEQGVELLAFRGGFFGTGDCLVQVTTLLIGTQGFVRQI